MAVAMAGAMAGAAPGYAIGVVFGVAALVRRTKPLHPRGQVGTGLLDVTTPRPELGVPLLAAASRHMCLVRWSRAMGLPAPLPDFEGFAIRFDDPTADLLFASTGTSKVTRFVLVPRASGGHGPQSTLLPVAAAKGALLLMVAPLDDGQPPTRWELAVAGAGSDWQPVGKLSVEWGPDRPTRFDPVEHALPGTEQYPVVRALREPAYLLARRGADAKT